jgi:hypothetical protein
MGRELKRAREKENSFRLSTVQRASKQRAVNEWILGCETKRWKNLFGSVHELYGLAANKIGDGQEREGIELICAALIDTFTSIKFVARLT